MKKVFKLKKVASADLVSEFVGKILYENGTEVEDNVSFFSGYNQKFLVNSNTNIALVKNQNLISDSLFNRIYSSNATLLNNNISLDGVAPQGKIIDVAQYDNFSFSLTIPTDSYTKFNNYGDKNIVVTYDPNNIDENMDEFTDLIDLQINSEKNWTSLYETNSLPYSYLFEQNLNKGISLSNNFEPNYIYFVMNKILVNPFKLKNNYNYDLNTNIDRSDNTLNGYRNYISVGRCQNNLWLKYNFVQDDNVLQNFEMVELVEGLYKYIANYNHKSNVFSIEFNDSGLNDNIYNSDIRLNIQNIIKNIIKEVIGNIIPAHTELYKINFTGK